MSSNRASSWAPEDSTTPIASTEEPDQPQITPTERLYVPHLFDLVTPTHRARDLTKQYIPSAYLQSEAIDSSTLLGRGASFAASRQALPPGPETIDVETDMGGWSIVKKSPAPKRPKYVVYKSAKVNFKDNGEPATAQDRRAMISVLTEFHALLHPPLLEHKNIIDFLGLAWGRNPSEPLHKLPVLVVEYAEKGTLSDLQSRHQQLTERVKLNLCLGVARGLSVLHENHIVHGDIKPDNILICSDPTDTYVAKLADFGFAIIEAVEAPEISIGGTRTWRSPESSRPIPKDLLRKTDIYSFGLLAWSLAIDGRSPFDLMVSDELNGEERLAAIDKLKDNDEVIQTARFENWVLRWQLFSVNSLLPPSATQNMGAVIAVLASPTRFQKVMEQATENDPSMGTQIHAMVMKLSDMMVKLRKGKLYYKDLEAVLIHTLSRDPTKRSLEPVISLLEAAANTVNSAALSMSSTNIGQDDLPPRSEDTGNVFNVSNHPDKEASPESTTNQQTPTTPALNLTPKGQLNEAQKANSSSQADTGPRQNPPDWTALGFKKRWLSWQQMRDLDPPLQGVVAKSFASSGADNTPGLFISGAFHINGYGSKQDSLKGVQQLLRAAQSGHAMSQAYLFRMYTACGIPLPDESTYKDYLDNHSRRGCRMAMKDLQIVDPEKAKHNRLLLKYGCAGTGALWYRPNQMLHGFTQPSLKTPDFSVDSLGTDENIRNLRVNQRGDYLIHFAAACSEDKMLKCLIEEKVVDVNLQNPYGETPLLCACRAGHAMPVKRLLDNGAKASIVSHIGETPLHWLLSFDDNINVAALGRDLIEKGGANIDAFTHVDVSYADFPSGSDLERQIKGTPLMWAVRFDHPRVVKFLLSMGADPRLSYPGGGPTCLEQAAYLHNPECLEIMVTHLEEKFDVYAPTPDKPSTDKRYMFSYGPLVRNAIHAADRFSMILRNGMQYLDRLHATLRYLKEKTILVRFQVGNQDESVIMLAAMEAHDEVVEWILDNKWRPEDINKPGGVAKRTPLLESVRWNRRPLFQMLIKHGADIHALAMNPYDEKRTDWSALHVFAHEAHNEDLTLVDDLIEAGIPVDGPPDNNVETPFNIAVRRHAFNLADRLLEFGADINATTTRSSLVLSPFPLTGLGHIIALNARYSITSLQYLLSNYQDAIDFIVEPERNLSVLHLAALFPEGLKTSTGERISRFDIDWETNRSIMRDLLEWYREPQQVNMKSRIEGKTALHLAVERGNVGVVEELVKRGVDKSVKSDKGETVAAILKKIWTGSRVGVEMGKLLVG